MERYPVQVLAGVAKQLQQHVARVVGLYARVDDEDHYLRRLTPCACVRSGVGRVGKVPPGPRVQAPELQAKFKKNNFPITVKL